MNEVLNIELTSTECRVLRFNCSKLTLHHDSPKWNALRDFSQVWLESIVYENPSFVAPAAEYIAQA